jgi:Uma2 family endonuclease
MATTTEVTRASLCLGPGDQGRPLTDVEYASAEFEEPYRYELVDGKLSVMPPDSEEHDDVSEPWRDYLGAYRLAHSQLVEKVVSEAWTRVTSGKYRIADIAVYLVGGRSAQSRPGRVPELVVEVISQGTTSYRRDSVEKRAEYHALGVLEYVLVDSLGGQVLVLTHALDGYQECELTSVDIYTTPLLPGLAIPLHQILPRT